MNTIQHITFESIRPVAAPKAAHPVPGRFGEPAGKPHEAAPTKPARETARPTAEQVGDLEKTADAQLADSEVHVTITMDDETSRVVVRVFDDQDELLHQFPSEEFLNTAERLEELRGLLFEAKG